MESLLTYWHFFERLWPKKKAPCLTLLSGDECTRELWWFPLLSFFSGVHTPGSVWVERSDSDESLLLFFQTDVPLLCSVSLLWGKTKASSSEPDGEHKTSTYWVPSHFSGGGIVGVNVRIWWEKGFTPTVTLSSGVGGGGARAGPSCVFVFLRALHSHQSSTVSVTVYPTVWETENMLRL